MARPSCVQPTPHTGPSWPGSVVLSFAYTSMPESGSHRSWMSQTASVASCEPVMSIAALYSLHACAEAGVTLENAAQYTAAVC